MLGEYAVSWRQASHLASGRLCRVGPTLSQGQALASGFFRDEGGDRSVTSEVAPSRQKRASQSY